MFTNQQINQLKDIYLEEFGIELTSSEAYERAVLLIGKAGEVIDKKAIKEKIEKLLFSEKNMVDNLALYFVSLARNINRSEK